MNDGQLRILLILLGLVQLAVGCWMTFATHSFAKHVAPFGHTDSHDLRDFATFFLALGIALLFAVSRPSWRSPILGLAALEYAFHTINHAVDVRRADPAWVGPSDLAIVGATTVIFAWLAWLSWRSEWSERISVHDAAQTRG